MEHLTGTPPDLYIQGLAHDLANVLTVLEARLELAERLPTGLAAHHVRRARSLSEEASLLAHQLMRYAEGRAPTRQPVPVAPLLRQAVESVLQDTRVRWQIAAHPDTRPLAADPVDAERVVRNLVANAAEAMDNNGPLIIGAVNGDGSEIDFVVLTFQDGGPGIDEARVSQLGQRQFSPKGGLHGIGLQVVHHLVQAHGGRVDISSRPGVGTAVRVLWPAWTAPLPSSSP
jgi:signal transduction histidine kinase